MLGILPETQKAFVAAILDATWRRHVHQRINYLANVFIQQQSDLKMVTKPKKTDGLFYSSAATVAWYVAYFRCDEWGYVSVSIRGLKESRWHWQGSTGMV